MHSFLNFLESSSICLSIWYDLSLSPLSGAEGAQPITSQVHSSERRVVRGGYEESARGFSLRWMRSREGAVDRERCADEGRRGGISRLARVDDQGLCERKRKRKGGRKSGEVR